MGCSIFNAAKRVLRPHTETVTVTAAETVTVTTALISDGCAASAETVTVTEAPSIESSSASNRVAAYAQQFFFGLDFSDSDEQSIKASSTLTSTTTSTFSIMTSASPCTMIFSSLSTTLSTVIRSSISSLATPSPTTTGKCVPTPLPSAVDRYTFIPLVDLSLEQSAAIAAVTVDDPHDPNSENCSPYTTIYLPDAAASSCVHLTGLWKPSITNVFYECVARTRAPDFNPGIYPQGLTGLNFTTGDDSSSIINTRLFGPRPERAYDEASLTLFVATAKTYAVDFWACGAGPTLIVGELSCTYYG